LINFIVNNNQLAVYVISAIPVAALTEAKALITLTL
jgi:hypothetical protein